MASVEEVRAMRDEGFDACYIFVSPTSIVALESRLSSSAAYSEVELESAIAQAQAEIGAVQKEASLFDYVIEHSSVADAGDSALPKGYASLRNIVLSEYSVIRRLINASEGEAEAEAEAEPSDAADNDQTQAQLWQEITGAEERLCELELKYATAKVLERITTLGMSAFAIKRVPDDFGSSDAGQRRLVVGASTCDHICESWLIEDMSTHSFIAVFIPANRCRDIFDTLIPVLAASLETDSQLLRFVDDDECSQVTGFAPTEALPPVGLPSTFRIILAQSLQARTPQTVVWFGGGHARLQLGLNLRDLSRLVSLQFMDFNLG
jgi:hypothetical protein